MEKTVFEINDYREACKFLQEKYDALGYIRYSYYHQTGMDNHLTKTNKISQAKVGLQYHHICEDTVPSLSDLNVASRNPIEYQAPDNMCYCNLLEHAWLHVLITEQNVEASDEDQNVITGAGGVSWMILALNSIYTNASTSWYSSKNEEGYGMNYNYNNIITDNRDQFVKVVNRYCTSAFIRQRLNKSNEELARGLALLRTKKDTNILSNVDDILKIAKDTYLFDWNVGAFADLLGFMKLNRSALIQICTGGGKTTCALELMRVTGWKTLVVGPSDTIKAGWENNDAAKKLGYKYINYQTLMQEDTYKKEAKKGYELIICDEAHHLGAERWSEGIKYLMENTNAKLVGLTATPTNAQFNGTDQYFGGRICYGLDLAEGIKNGNIHAFSYISAIYRMADMEEEFAAKGEVGRQLWNKLNLSLNANPVEKILHKHMPEGQRKIIVFCSSKADMDYARDIMIKYDKNFANKDYCRKIFSDQDKQYNSEAKKWFNNTSDHDVCLLTVAMVNEGAHYNGVNTLIMFRRTNSATLYLQQLGRVVVTSKNPDPHGIVFDFTNNADNLIANQKIEIWEESENKEATTETIKKIREVIKKVAEQNEVIYKDYTEDCANVLAALKDSKTSAQVNGAIYASFMNISMNEGIEDLGFDTEAWSELKTKNSGKTKIEHKKSGIHARSHELSDALDRAIAGGVVSKKMEVDASAAERLATAFSLALKRAYTFGVISFSDTAKVQISIKDQRIFNQTIKNLGFKKSSVFEKVMNKLGIQTYLIATNIE
jgi:superfamily II DNA or RNA helicase